jgi:hypothetical protein
VGNKFQLFGYLNYTQNQSIGFVLPLFKNDKKDLDYLQVPHRQEKAIDTFLVAEHKSKAVELGRICYASPGDPLVYVFINVDGKVHAGTLEQLKPILRGFASGSAQHPEVIMQIEELFGNEQSRFVATRSFIGTMKSLAPTQSATRSFVESDIRNWIWSRLLDKKPANNSGLSIYRELAKIKVRLAHNFQVQFDESANTIWSNRDIEEIVESASSYYSVIFNELREAETLAAEQLEPSIDLLYSIMREYNDAGSQTKRLAVLLKAIFEYPDYSRSITNKIRTDRAKLASDAIIRIRHALVHTKFDGSDLDRHRMLAIAWSSLSKGTSWLKADFLFYLAELLKNEPVVNLFVFRKLDASSSFVFSNLHEHLTKNRGYKKIVGNLKNY